MSDVAKPVLDRVKVPADMRGFSIGELRQLSDELRQETIEAVSVTGGHLGAGLGVVELTVAIHHVFNTPDDRLIWDVGHQAYPHKILTGRRDRIRTLRKGGGLSGFTKRSESDYDPFGAAHSSTSISAGLGMAVGRDLLERDNQVIAVIGDGAISAGMAYEALNNAGASKARMLVVLNDNDMSIAPAVGAMSGYLSQLITSKPYQDFRDFAHQFVSQLPEPFEETARRAEEYARRMVIGGTLFEELGFDYLGPVDGHDLELLVPILRNVRDGAKDGPVLLHVVTEKGRGHPFEKVSVEKYHAVGTFDADTGTIPSSKANAPSYTAVFAEALIREAEKDDRITAITAAMPTGTGVAKFEERFPDRTFDVGIAEQHAVTFAAGMASEGLKPFCAIYSTFLQRGYDQVVHDVALQGLPVRFGIDRAGLVGADGATHAGAFDLGYLGALPGFVIMAASDEAELARMVATAAAYDDGPSAVRYPRGEGVGVDVPTNPDPLEIGKGRMIRRGEKVAILSLGGRLHEALAAADALAEKGLSPTVADARFMKPLDTELIRSLAKEHDALITVEEGAIGGFGSHVLAFLAAEGLLDGDLKVRTLFLPDEFIDHDNPAKQYAHAGLDADAIVAAVTHLTSP